MGNWLRAHRKQALIHTFVVVGFVLLVIFVAEPLFDRLEGISGESRSRLHDVSLPAATTNIQYHIDHFITDDRFIEIHGWAFIDGEDSVSNEAFVVLESGSRTYVFDTMVRTRADVTQHFEDLGLNLDHSGFMASIPASRIADGEYAIGIYIRKGHIDGLIYTNRAMTKHRGTVEITG